MAFRTTRATAVLSLLVLAALLNVAAAADSTQLETITMPAPPEDAGFNYSWETRKGKKNAKDVLVVGPVVTGVKGQGQGNGSGGGKKKAVDTAAAAEAAAKKADPQVETITMPAPPADAGFEYSWETRKGKKNQKDVTVVGPVVTGVKGQDNGNGGGKKKAVDAASAEAEAKKTDPYLETIMMPAPPADAGFEFSWETRKGKKSNKDVLVVGPVVTGVKSNNGNGNGGKKAVDAASEVAAAKKDPQLETITMPAPPEDAGFEYSWETRKGKKNQKDVTVVGPVVTGVKGQDNGNGGGKKKAVDAASAEAEAKKTDPYLETIMMPAPPADAGFEFSWETRKGKKSNKDVLVVGPVVTGVKSNNGNGNGGKKAVDAASEVAAAKKDPQLETITMPAPPEDAGFEYSWETRKGKKDQKDVLVVGPVVTGVKDQGNGKKSQDGSVAAASSDAAPAASGVSSSFIGIAVGAGVVLAAAVGAAVMVHRRRARKSYGSVEAAVPATDVQPDRLVLNQH
ncbi:hypothetical protein AMAG_06534 [Allomyces macrogynus ATCC 38327]|uniref:Uncharacterized protein n=1 Tax=Allomyces macrogynus (strain ATCC 38327) TaxID=578462 RepID=A0A0L0SH06_ALLM3|nr:hypothetical protein AMAG_06534 [Allomyces macrogynus ATCC 38327]|eukprot:KNE61732.1 hypothetical protein AMAG_06534 [Allomyces macrogynus ATCC 38327]